MNDHWRDSQRPVRLYGIDVRILGALAFWVLWPRLWSLVVAIVLIGFLVGAGLRGYRPNAALRAIRSSLAGPPRAWSPLRYGRKLDHGGRTLWAFCAALLMCPTLAASGHAAFDYIPPDPQTSLVAAATPSTLGRDAATGPRDLAHALTALLPPGIVLRFDKRVDPHQPVARYAGANGVNRTARYSNWQALLNDVGLRGRTHRGEVHVYPAALAPTEIEPGPPVGNDRTWHVQAGQTLKDVLERWGARAGVETIYLTDREWALQYSYAFRGTYEEALRALLFALRGQPARPVGELAAGGRVLLVHHAIPKNTSDPRADTGPVAGEARQTTGRQTR